MLYVFKAYAFDLKIKRLSDLPIGDISEGIFSFYKMKIFILKLLLHKCKLWEVMITKYIL